MFAFIKRNSKVQGKERWSDGRGSLASRPDYTHIHFEGQQAALRKTKLPLSPYREESGPFRMLPMGS